MRGSEVVAYDLGLLALAGVARVEVVRRPSVLCVVLRPQAVGTAAADLLDVNGPLLRELVLRDGGTAVMVHPLTRDVRAVLAAITGQNVDLVIMSGGTGTGASDVSVAALSAVGYIAIDGVALQPGETAGLGRLATGTPVCLLPGTPPACLWAYEFLAGRAIRRLGGREPALPWRVHGMITARKINSIIGMTEIVPVRTVNRDRVEPVAPFAEVGLAALAAADGFVIIAEGSEGVAEGTEIGVCRYRGQIR